MSTYPGTVDSFQVISGTTLVTDVPHHTQHNTEGSALIALETLLGTAATNVTGVLVSFTSSDKAAMRGKLHFSSTAINLGTTAPTSGQSLIYNGTSIVGTTISSFTSPLTTKGDIYAYGTADTRLAVGADGRILMANSAQASGLQWVNSLGTLDIANLDLNTSSTANLRSSTTSGVIRVANVMVPPSTTLNDTVGTIDTTFNGIRTPEICYLILGTAAGNRTLSTPSNLTATGQPITYAIKQNAGNTGTIVWGTIHRFSSDTGTPTLGTASTWNYYNFIYNIPGGTVLDFISQTKNII